MLLLPFTCSASSCGPSVKKKNKNFVEWVSFMLSLPFFSKRKAGFLDVQPARIGSFTRQIVGCSLDSVSLGCVKKFIIFNKLMFSVLRCKLVCLKLCFLVFLGSSKWKTKTRCSCYLSLVQLPAVGHLLKKNKNFVEWVSFMLSLPFLSKRKGGFLEVQPACIGSFTRQIVGCSLDSVSLGCV